MKKRYNTHADIYIYQCICSQNSNVAFSSQLTSVHNKYTKMTSPKQSDSSPKNTGKVVGIYDQCKLN